MVMYNHFPNFRSYIYSYTIISKENYAEYSQSRVGSTNRRVTGTKTNDTVQTGYEQRNNSFHIKNIMHETIKDSYLSTVIMIAGGFDMTISEFLDSPLFDEENLTI